MIGNMQSRAQRNQTKRIVIQSKPVRGNTYKSQDHEESKQDRPSNCQSLLSIKKFKSIKQSRVATRTVSTEATFRKEAKFLEMREKIITHYSKLQFFFDSSMESMFLAIDIFDRFTNHWLDKLSIAELLNVGLACYMIAIKYEEIYPATLDQVQSKMKINISYQEFLQLEIKILKTLNYCLNIASPISYLDYFDFEMTEQKKSYIYHYLQIAALSHQCKHTFQWSQIMEAITILFKPINYVMEKQNDLNSEINICLKMLLQGRTIFGNHYWLNKKYSSSKFYYVSSKPTFYIENQEDQE